ncbi:MAG TPA: hypothetical protein VGF94_21280 [Kofleriaceae bacterium]
MKWLVLVAVVACGGQRQQIQREQESFACKDREASYMVAKDISGDERGVQIDCTDAGPRVKRWKTAHDGTHVEDAHGITPGDFDKAWAQIDGTGWPNLHDCANGSLGKRDPVYQFDIHDDQNKASFSCQTREVPYPYFDITNALDVVANQGRKQLGDDEPADAKALDKKDNQK